MIFDCKKLILDGRRPKILEMRFINTKSLSPPKSYFQKSYRAAQPIAKTREAIRATAATFDRFGKLSKIAVFMHSCV